MLFIILSIYPDRVIPWNGRKIANKCAELYICPRMVDRAELESQQHDFEYGRCSTLSRRTHDSEPPIVPRAAPYGCDSRKPFLQPFYCPWPAL